MNIRLQLLQIHTPIIFRRKGLAQIFALTASAFDKKPPLLKGMSDRERLRAYALFTRQECERILRRPADVSIVRKRLFQNALLLGQTLRKVLRIENESDMLAGLGVLYRILQIDWRGNRLTALVVRQCYFSRYYSPAVCQLISALDEGIVAGMSGGGRLEFTQRLTSGQECCLARIDFPDGMR